MKLSLAIALMFSITSLVTMAAPLEPLEKRGLKSCYKHATLTQYWIPKEGDKDEDNDGNSVSLTGPKTKELRSSSGKTIAKVSEATYEKFQMEGTGLLKDGQMVNLDSGKDEFMTVDRKKDPFGIGEDDDVALDPWVSVAANDLDRGTTLYIKELDGFKLPGGKAHNGCVRVDDEGWSFDGCQLDFFVLKYDSYKAMENGIPEKVSVEQKDCTVQNYVTSQVKKWAVLGGGAGKLSDDSDSSNDDDDDSDKKDKREKQETDYEEDDDEEDEGSEDEEGDDEKDEGGDDEEDEEGDDEDDEEGDDEDDEEGDDEDNEE
ncbi:hypothetical protein INT45_003841, partial [Circinella minor]